jgi:P-type Cu2+ transporter
MSRHTPKQNLFWAAIYNVIAMPIAAGVRYPSLGLMLRPEFGALALSASSITVVANALLLRRTVPVLGPRGRTPSPPASLTHS